MSTIKITSEEIKKIVKESNQELLEDMQDTHSADTYPYYGNELTVARKQKLGSYEKYVNTCLQSLKMMVEEVNSQYVNKNIQRSDVEFLINDQLQRLQDSINYTISSLQAIVQNDGQKLHGAGPQFPAMMEEQESEFGTEKTSTTDIRKAGVAQGKEAAAASGLTAQERPVIKQLNGLIIQAATKANITTGKTAKLIKLLAVELQKLAKT